MAIQRTSDGIPKYDGSPETLAMYKEECVQYLMTFEYRKRYLAGPRLLKELEGTAKLAVRAMTLQNPQWVAHPRGVYTLLEFLEQVVARPSLPEASRFVTKFFYGMSRRKNETMTSWITRHAEGLWEASQALRKVQKEVGKPSKSGWSSGSARSEDEPRLATRQRGGPFRDDGKVDEDEESEAADGWWQEGSWKEWSEWSYSTWRTDEYEPPTTWDTSSDIFIPEFLAGFLLLMRSGLDTNERANILAAIRGEFSPSTVGRALREQWSDDDILRRDRQKASAALYAEEDGDEEMTALMAEDDHYGSENLSQEEQEAYWLEQEKIEEAMTAIRTQKATLREARWKQKQLKLGRGYFPPKPFAKASGKGQTAKPGGSQEGPCFKCGGSHKIANCPRWNQQQAKAATEEEAAEIAFYAACEKGTEQILMGQHEEAFNIETIVDSCMGIVDSGATASLASIDALEAVRKANYETHGNAKMTVDPSRRPTFRFGNGAKADCLSTVTMAMGAGHQQGKLEVHVHDAPGQPVLISKRALKALGAVVDFETGDVIFKRVDKTKVGKFQEASNGHFLMPLTGNILDGARTRSAPFDSLHE